MILKKWQNQIHLIIHGVKCCNIIYNLSERYGFKKIKGGKIIKERVKTLENEWE